MKRKFITSLGFLLTLNLLIKPVYVFGIDRVVQNTVGAEVYGRFFMLLNVALIFQILLDLGIENFIRKEVARNPEKASGYFSNILLLKLMLLVPYSLICILVALLRNFLSGDYFWLFLLILINHFLASFILFIRANLGAFQLFRTESVVSVLDRTLMIMVVGTLLLYPATKAIFRINWFVIAQTFSYSVALTAGIILLRKNSVRLAHRIDLKQFVPVIKQLFPFATLVLLMALYYRADSIFLGLLLPDGDVQAGIFAHGFRILDFMTNYALLFPILLLPIFSKTIHQKQKVDGLLQLAALLLIIPSITVIVPALVYREQLFQLLYTEHIMLSANAFAILSISFIGMCICYTFGALLTANGNLKQLNIMAALAVVISVVLNLILIPRYKVLGAAMANAAAQLFTLFFHIILASGIFRLKLNVKLVIRLAIFLLSLAGAAQLIQIPDLNWLVGSAILISTGMLLALLLKLVHFRGILFILRQEE